MHMATSYYFVYCHEDINMCALSRPMQLIMKLLRQLDLNTVIVSSCNLNAMFAREMCWSWEMLHLLKIHICSRKSSDYIPDPPPPPKIEEVLACSVDFAHYHKAQHVFSSQCQVHVPIHSQVLWQEVCVHKVCRISFYFLYLMLRRLMVSFR